MGVVYTLQPHVFNSAIRFIKTAELGKVLQFQLLVASAMERLEVEPNSARAIPGRPEGSDHFNVNNAREWSLRIPPSAKPAIKQLIAIDATIKSRIDL